MKAQTDLSKLGPVTNGADRSSRACALGSPAEGGLLERGREQVGHTLGHLRAASEVNAHGPSAEVRLGGELIQRVLCVHPLVAAVTKSNLCP